ncbi:MAG: rhodanese-like domain-containing protein [Pirellulales bacterium]
MHLATLSTAFRRTLTFVLPCLLAVALTADEPAPRAESLDTVKMNLAAKKAVLLDVRERGEWDEGHLLGATLLPVTKIREGADPKATLPDAAKPGMIIYCHCRAGRRAADAAEILRKKGYDARPLKEGFEDLLKAGFTKAP